MRRSNQIWITIICILLGIISSAQLRTQAEIRQDIPTKRIEEMTSLLKQAESERDSLRIELSKLKAQLNDVMNQEKNVTSRVQDELQQARGAAGLTDMEGPGLVVTLKDSTRVAQAGQDPNLFLIHDEDLLKLVNELKAAGGEAITVNDQRIVASTEIRCAGPTISVNNTRIGPPYIIKAVGSPTDLENALKMRGGIIETIQFWGIQVQMEKKEHLLVPAFVGSHSFRYAHPVIEEGDQS